LSATVVDRFLAFQATSIFLTIMLVEAGLTVFGI
jgi:hypothetical protein